MSWFDEQIKQRKEADREQIEDSFQEIAGAVMGRRMSEALNAEPDATPQQILRNVRGAVDTFVRDAEQFDDLTMLCFEYKGRSAPEETAEERPS